jgi:hypothetical protein
MKKKIILFFSMAFFVISSASSWEGAAATSSDGGLPADGHYVATNAFPRNTVVDIVNIETNKSTRAIVAAGLENPGLLAVVSREAAEIIGMRPGSISRIRMTQPSDPVAYLRFTEGIASGISPYDSGNVITQETYRDTPPAGEAAGSNVPPIFLEQEWGGRRRDDIVDLFPRTPFITGSEEPSVESVGLAHEEEEETPSQVVEAFPDEKEETLSQVVEAVPEEEEETPSQVVEAVPEEEEEAPSQVVEAVPDEEEEVPSQVVEAVPEEEEEVPPQVVEAVPEEEEETADQQPIPQYTLVPSQKRPPQGTIYGIDPSEIIPQVQRTSAAEPERELVLEPIIESIPAAERAPVTENTPAMERIPVTERAPSAGTNYSVYRIDELNRGSYYVQLASVDTLESAQSVVNLIDRNYEPKVYRDGDNSYRIILRPMNQGESAAVLQRFRSIGYGDAFVRYVR